jgi:hypothetical protein
MSGLQITVLEQASTTERSQKGEVTVTLFRNGGGGEGKSNPCRAEWEVLRRACHPQSEVTRGPEKSGLSLLVVLELLPRLSSRIVSLTPAGLAYPSSKFIFDCEDY